MSADAAPLPRHSIRAVATKGAVLFIAQGAAARFVLLGSQLALGWLLTPDDFGIVAIVTVLTTIAWEIIGFGTDSVLQQRARTMHLWERTAFWVGLGQGVCAMIVMVLAAPVLAAVYKTPDVIAPVLVAALGMPFAGLAIVPMARTFARFGFQRAAAINMLELLTVQALTILFAWGGLKAMALFLPLPFGFALRAVLLWLGAREPMRGRFRMRLVQIILRRGSLIFSSRITASLISQGDYLVLGLVAAKQAVGYYFFAFRLAAAPMRIVAASLRSILFPVLSHLRRDSARADESARRAAETLSYIVTPLCLLQAALAGPVVSLLFGSRWENSIILIQILSLGLPAEAISTVARARMDAEGNFLRSLKFNLVCAVIFFVTCWAGAAAGAAVGAAIAVALYYIVTQPVVFLRVFRSSRPMEDLWRVFILPMVLSLFAAIAAFLAAAATPGGALAAVGVTPLVFGVVYLAALRIATPRLAADLFTIARDFLRRRAGAVSEALP